MILLNADSTFPYYMCGVRYFADMWQQQCFSHKEYRIPDLEGQPYLHVITKIPGHSYG